MENKKGRPQTYKTEEDKHQAKLNSKKIWRQNNKAHTEPNDDAIECVDDPANEVIQYSQSIIELTLDDIPSIKSVSEFHTYSIEEFHEKYNYSSPHLVLIRGAPNSGKTTFGNIVYKDYEQVSYNDYFVENPDSEITDAHVWCISKLRESLMNNKNVVVTNLFKLDCELLDYLDFVDIASLQIIKMVGIYTETKKVSEFAIQLYDKGYEPYSGEIYVKLDVTNEMVIVYDNQNVDMDA